MRDLDVSLNVSVWLLGAAGAEGSCTQAGEGQLGHMGSSGQRAAL